MTPNSSLYVAPPSGVVGGRTRDIGCVLILCWPDVLDPGEVEPMPIGYRLLGLANRLAADIKPTRPTRVRVCGQESEGKLMLPESGFCWNWGNMKSDGPAEAECRRVPGTRPHILFNCFLQLCLSGASLNAKA